MSQWFVATDSTGAFFKIRRIPIDRVNTRERDQLRDGIRRLSSRLPALKGPSIERFAGLEESIESLDLAYLWIETREYSSTQVPRVAADAIADLTEVAAALDEAHRLGIVHGALRPASLSRAANHVVVSEFLVERAIYRFALLEEPLMEGRFFESPEQIQETGESGASDQFALAAIAYVWLTGCRPFEADKVPTLHYRICKEQPPPAQTLNSFLTEATSDVLLKGLAKRPEDRFHNCAEFVSALRKAQGLEFATAAAGTANAGEPDEGNSAGKAAAVVVAVPIAEQTPAEPHTAEPIPTKPSTTEAPIFSALGGPTAGGPRGATTRRRQNTEVRKGSAGRWLKVAFLAGLIAALCIWLWRTWSPTPQLVQQAADPREGPTFPAPSEDELKAPEAGGIERGHSSPGSTTTGQKSPPVGQNRGRTGLVGRDALAGKGSPAERGALPGGIGPATRAATTGGHSSPSPAPPSPEVVSPSKPGPMEVQITTTPSGVHVILDGDQSLACTSPCSMELSPGRHTLSATGPGLGIEKRIFNIPEDRQIIVNLQQNAGMLLVTSEPSGAWVQVDGMDAGRTPASLRLSVGQHHLVVLNGKLRAEDTVNISREQVASRTYRW